MKLIFVALRLILIALRYFIGIEIALAYPDAMVADAQKRLVA